MLHAVGLAVAAAGEAESEDAAHALVWDAMRGVDSWPMYIVLAMAGVDLDAVETALAGIEHEQREQEREQECDQLRKALR